MQKIIPFLWFDNQAEEAVNFYTSIFKNSKIVNVARYDEEGAKVSGRPKGTVMTVTFQLNGQEFIALNGGPQFKFTEAISFFVNCETQAEVDELWNKLTEGGEEVQCGWLKDRFGLSWQISPTVLGEMLADQDPAKAQRVMKAMLQIKQGRSIFRVQKNASPLLAHPSVQTPDYNGQNRIKWTGVGLSGSSDLEKPATRVSLGAFAGVGLYPMPSLFSAIILTFLPTCVLYCRTFHCGSFCLRFLIHQNEVLFE